MIIKPIVIASMFLAISSSSYAWQQPSNLVGTSSTFSISQKTQVPGEILKPGDYTIHVVDQMQDRMIVRVDSNSTKDHAIFLGVPHTELGQGNNPGPLTWNSGTNGTAALRGFEFSPQSTVEFVYPKAEAVDLAKRNTAKVVAVDPDSEGKPVLKNMSPEDMHVIHLWMLSLTTTGPNDKTPAIQAQKYQGEVIPQSPALARNTEPRSGQGQTEVASVDRFTAPTGNPPKHQSVIAKLPHTASPLPLIGLFGLLSLLAAGIVRIVRLSTGPIE